MPNWCEGTLKVRGEQENIRRFLLEAIEAETDNDVIVEEDDERIVVSLPNDGSYSFYIKDSIRNFIFRDEIVWYKCGLLLIDDYRGAWGIDSSALTELSKEYNLDIKIYAFEHGIGFNIDFEVHEGVLIKNETIVFDDYDWECACPFLGG